MDMGRAVTRLLPKYSTLAVTTCQTGTRTVEIEGNGPI